MINSVVIELKPITSDKNIVLQDRTKLLNVLSSCTLNFTHQSYPVGSIFTILVESNVSCIAHYLSDNTVKVKLLDVGFNYAIARDNNTLNFYNASGIDDTIESQSSAYDVWLIAGQSNASGTNTSVKDALIDFTNSRVLQFSQYATEAAYLDKAILATDPLKHPDTATRNADSVGIGLQFGKTMIEQLPLNRSILLVPCGVGSTGMLGGGLTWNPYTNGSDYARAISASNKAMALNPNNRFGGVLWLLGEAEANSSININNEIAALQTLINNFRTLITGASKSVFLIGSMVPDWIGSTATKRAIEFAQRQIPLLVDRAWYVEGNYNAHDSVDNMTSAIIHYNGVGVRSLGKELAKATKLAESNVSTVVPSTPVLSLDSNYSNNYNLSWTCDYAHSYELQLKTGNGSYTDLYSVGSQNALIKKAVTLYNLSLNTTYQVRVRSVSRGGYSAYSNELTINVPNSVTPTPSALPVPRFRCNRDFRNIDSEGKINALWDISGNKNHFLKKAGSRPIFSSNGSAEVIEFQNNGYLVGVSGSYPSASDFTLHALIYLHSFAQNGVIFGANNGVGNTMALWRHLANNQSLKFDHNGTFTAITTTKQLVLNQWFNVWLTFRNIDNLARIYINDEKLAEGVVGEAITSPTIFFNTYNSTGNGSAMDAISFGCWNTQLSDAQIASENARLIDTYGITVGTPI